MSDFGSQPPSNPPPSFPAPPPPPPPPNMAPPPGYVAYGSPGAAMSGQFSRVGGVSKALGVLMMIYVPLQVLGIFSLFDVRNKARDFLNGDITEKKFNEASQANVGSLAGLLVIPIAVLTIILMFRMAKNLQVLGRQGATWKPGWAIGGWFCPPCVIYAIPWLMWRELWKGSNPEVVPNDPSWKSTKVSPLVDAWWVLFGLLPIVSVFTLSGLFANIRSFQAEDVAQRLVDYIGINIALAVVQIGAAIVYLMMVRQLSALHMRATHEA